MNPFNPNSENLFKVNSYLKKIIQNQKETIQKELEKYKSVELSLFESENRFRTFQDISLDAFTILKSIRDENNRIIDFVWTYVNPVAGTILLVPPEELVGKRLLSVLPENKENKDLFERYVQITESGIGNEIELRYESNGITGWFWNMAVKLGDGVAVAFRDITVRKEAEILLKETNELLEKRVQERTAELVQTNKDLENTIEEYKKLEKTLNFLANHDYLTALPNRKYFNEKLKVNLKIAHENNSHFAVLFIDLDHFKDINDTLGHNMGDEILKIISKDILSFIKEREIIFSRAGGDEFIVYLEDINPTNKIDIFCKELLNIFTKPYKIQNQEIFLTASIGVSIYPNDGNDIHTLIKNADLAMYNAKNLGRNRYEFYKKELSDSIQERTDIEKSLRGAIEKGEFHILYQPQIDMETDKLIGAEALIRWINPELGNVSPAKFIPIAEDNGTIHAIGKWVFNEVCLQIQKWHKSGFLIPKVSINLSVKQIEQGNLFEYIQDFLKEIELSPVHLELEITESVFMKNIGKNIEVLDMMRTLGFAISVDDFGTGYSSLKYLKRLPINKLKIDQSFIRDISQASNDEAIVLAIISLAKNLGHFVIAEGVENLTQKEFLLKNGCRFAQGYLYSKPISSTELVAKYQNQF